MQETCSNIINRRFTTAVPIKLVIGHCKNCPFRKGSWWA